jgi:hypothetical protein
MKKIRKIKHSTNRAKNLYQHKKRDTLCDDAWYAKALERDFFRRHPYYIKSDLPYYFFAYVDSHSGWELYRPVKIVFLYDMISHKMDYSRLIYERKFDDICHPIISFEYMGSRFIEKPPIDRMFTFKPKNLKNVWDSGETLIYIKNGIKKRFEWIISENESKYEPFAWLFDLFEEVSKVIPYEMLDENGNWVDVRKYNKEHHPEMFESKDFVPETRKQ